MRSNQSLKLTEPAVNDFAARQYAGHDMISRYVRATNYMELTVRRRQLSSGPLGGAKRILQMNDLPSIYKDIEDRLAPQLKLDAWERTTYYYLLRHTRLIDKDSALFSISSLSQILPLSDFKVREVLRSLDRKGCTKNEVTRRGYQIKVYLPTEIVSLKNEIKKEIVIDINTIDFFTGRKYVERTAKKRGISMFLLSC